MRIMDRGGGVGKRRKVAILRAHLGKRFALDDVTFAPIHDTAMPWYPTSTEAAVASLTTVFIVP